VLAFVVLIFVFTNGQPPVKIDYYYTLVFLFVAAIAVEFNFYVLIPYLLKKERYFLYLFSLVFLGFGFGTLLKLFFIGVIDSLFPNYFFISYISGNDFYLVFNILLVSSTLLKLAEDWIYYNKTRNDILLSQKQHIQTQLSALRSQINPHFLFNALNVIYSMALENKAHLTTAIVELSDILRYVIYDTNTERVALKDEITLLKNYIAFQKHRTDQVKVKFDVKVNNSDFEIYPMLLLPLVENAFKYGTSPDRNQTQIEIVLKQEEHMFLFYVKNEKIETLNHFEDYSSGIGLKTLKENLNIVYGKNHKFDIQNTNDYFTTSITLQYE
jgi:sensor histidine kinase YesM